MLWKSPTEMQEKSDLLVAYRDKGNYGLKLNLSCIFKWDDKTMKHFFNFAFQKDTL